MKSTSSDTHTAKDALIQAGQLAAEGRYREAIERLMRDYDVDAVPELARELINLRIRGFSALLRHMVDWDPEFNDYFGDVDGLPEINAVDLDLKALRAGILGKGGLIVRGLVGSELCEELRACIDRAAVCRQQCIAEGDGPSDNAWYCEPEEVEGKIADYDDSLWTANSPPTAAKLIQLYTDLDFPDLLGRYFGEQATLSVRKWVLRDVAPKNGAESGWHQDGRFMGEDIRTVNLWLSLSECGQGTSAPGIEIVADNSRKIYPTGTHGAPFDWTVGQGLVDELSQQYPVVRPRFEPGDAVIFDHFNLHRTAFGLNDTQHRYAVETWFFAASLAPLKQQPMLL